MASKWRSQFSPVLNRENFKILLINTAGLIYIIIGHRQSLGDPLSRLFKLYRSVEKMAARDLDHVCHFWVRFTFSFTHQYTLNTEGLL